MSVAPNEELWLSESEGDEQEDEFTDGVSFSLDLTHQGPAGDFRTRNKPGQRQRVVVSDFETGRRRKPAYRVSCEAKAMIHGKWGGAGPDCNERASLLVYEFEFHSYRGRRLKAADIRFRFEPMPGHSSQVFVAGIRPDGVFKVERTEQSERDVNGLALNVGSQPFGDASVTAANEKEVEKIVAYHTVITGDRPSDIYGDRYEAHFSLAENRSQGDGIPTRLRTCILLKRGTDDDFVCHPFIHVTPDFKTLVGQLASSRDRDDPIWFSPSEVALNRLDRDVVVHEDNLAEAPLDKLWDCTMYTARAGAVKR